jgi:hypothetical protein
MSKKYQDLTQEENNININKLQNQKIDSDFAYLVHDKLADLSGLTMGDIADMNESLSNLDENSRPSLRQLRDLNEAAKVTFLHHYSSPNSNSSEFKSHKDLILNIQDKHDEFVGSLANMCKFSNEFDSKSEYDAFTVDGFMIVKSGSKSFEIQQLSNPDISEVVDFNSPKDNFNMSFKDFKSVLSKESLGSVYDDYDSKVGLCNKMMNNESHTLMFNTTNFDDMFDKYDKQDNSDNTENTHKRIKKPNLTN